MSERFPRPRAVAVVLGAVLVVGACSGAGTQAPATQTPGTTGGVPTQTASAPPSGPADLGTLKLGLGTSPPDPTSHYFYYANENGSYESRGLAVEVVPFNGDQTSLRALASGDVDLLWTGCAAALQAMEIGAQFKIISSFAPNIDYQLVVQTGITRPKDLEGKNLGVSQPGAVSWSVPKLMVEADGGDFDAVNVVSIGGSSARVQALIAKTIDGAVLNGSFAARTEAYDYLESIADGVSALPDYIYSCEVVHERTLAERKDALQAFVTGTMEGVQVFYEDPDAYVPITQSLLPDVDPAELEVGVMNFYDKEFWKVGGTLAQRAFDFTVQAAQESGELAGPLNYGDVVDTELTENAREELGIEG